MALTDKYAEALTADAKGAGAWATRFDREAPATATPDSNRGTREQTGGRTRSNAWRRLRGVFAGDLANHHRESLRIHGGHRPALCHPLFAQDFRQQGFKRGAAGLHCQALGVGQGEIDFKVPAILVVGLAHDGTQLMQARAQPG